MNFNRACLNYNLALIHKFEFIPRLESGKSLIGARPTSKRVPQIAFSTSRNRFSIIYRLHKRLFVNWWSKLVRNLLIVIFSAAIAIRTGPGFLSAIFSFGFLNDYVFIFHKLILVNLFGLDWFEADCYFGRYWWSLYFGLLWLCFWKVKGILSILMWK